MYYKLGNEQFKQFVSQAGRSWSEFGLQRPALRKAVILGLILVTIVLLVGGLAPTYAPEQTKSLTDYLSTGLGA